MHLERISGVELDYYEIMKNSISPLNIIFNNIIFQVVREIKSIRIDINKYIASADEESIKKLLNLKVKLFLT